MTSVVPSSFAQIRSPCRFSCWVVAAIWLLLDSGWPGLVLKGLRVEGSIIDTDAESCSILARAPEGWDGFVSAARGAPLRGT